LEILLDARLEPGRDLLFIDEIQACPRALLALRYLYEECPDLHVIAAGSLLEFAFRDISFPVGRVQFLAVEPMSFAEYLLAVGKERASELVRGPPKLLPDAVHRMLLGEVRKYMFVGGMPECVAAYVRTGSLREAFAVQAELASTYRADFAKYSPSCDSRCLDAVLLATARTVGQQVKYTRLADGFSGPTIKKAVDLLCLARVIRRVPSAKPGGLPLGASANPRRFKALMVDIGVMQHLCGLRADVEFQRQDLLAIHAGSMAEQFVGQELAASGCEELHFWARQQRSSTAEVDFLITVGGEILPIEVKSGPAGKLRSLHLLLSSYPNCGIGCVLSTAAYGELPEQRLRFVPLYFASALGNLPDMPRLGAEEPEENQPDTRRNPLSSDRV